MKVLIYGGGGREHALADKISSSPLCKKLFVWPGNAVTRKKFACLDCPENSTRDVLLASCRREQIDLIIFGPEAPLAAGLSTFFTEEGIKTFGPCAIGAQLESSKAFAKELMQAASLPTAAHEVFTDRRALQARSEELLRAGKQVVLKASGLAGGKGVFICEQASTLTEALEHFYESDMQQAAEKVVLEEFLTGRECSHFALIHNNKPVSLGFAVDFKRLENGDKGPNTGGMGSYTPVQWLPRDAEQRVMQEILDPLMIELAKRGIQYTGFLYTGLMWNEGPKIIEFNVRLGDPEAQIICVADDRDWLPVISGQETSFAAEQKNHPTVGVVMTSDGYPFASPQQPPGLIPDSLLQDRNCKVFTASVTESHARNSFTSGKGRVLCVVAKAESLAAAKDQAYAQVERIHQHWQGAYYRTDIAERAVKELT